MSAVKMVSRNYSLPAQFVMSSCVVVVRSSVHCMSDDFSVPSFFAFWRSARSWWLVKYGGQFPYVGEEQVNVEIVRGGLTHPTGSRADGGAAAEDIVVVNAAVSVTYHGGSL